MKNISKFLFQRQNRKKIKLVCSQVYCDKPKNAINKRQ